MATVNERLGKNPVIGYDLFLSPEEASAVFTVLGHVKLGYGEGEHEIGNVLRAMEGAGVESEHVVTFSEWFEGTREWVDLESPEDLGLRFIQEDESEDGE